MSGKALLVVAVVLLVGVASRCSGSRGLHQQEEPPGRDRLVRRVAGQRPRLPGRRVQRLLRGQAADAAGRAVQRPRRRLRRPPPRGRRGLPQLRRRRRRWQVRLHHAAGQGLPPPPRRPPCSTRPTTPATITS
ncbi:Protodermal factor 1 [Zea mays]|uniref:Protodermal factor 1 n=1 Tax=Zea mays TaxID=4577 RepID=A0A1D6LT66_MAIZE|nr:Protodermal factor 1 [Zea mays]